MNSVSAFEKLKLKTKYLNVAYTKRRLLNLIINILIYVLLLELVFIFVYPFLFMVVNSFKSEAELRDINRMWVVAQPTLANYIEALELLNFWDSLANTFVIVIFSTIGHVVSASFIAYGFARFKFPGRNLMFGLVMLSLIVPPQILTMPLYIQYARIGWIGTFFPIIVPTFFGFGLRGGFFIFIFRQFFKSLPRSYEEAAKIEGCSSLDIFFRIILPISKTSILVVGILSIIWHWNDYFEPFIFLRGPDTILTQMLARMPDWFYWSQLGTGQSINPVQLAASFLVILPVLIMFVFFQRQFIQGVETSGLAN